MTVQRIALRTTSGERHVSRVRGYLLMGVLNRCPLCSHKLSVIDSRSNYTTATVRRRRRCQNISCGHRVTTFELTEAKYKELLRNAGFATQLVYAINAINATDEQ